MKYILILILISICSCKTEPQTDSRSNADAERRDLSEAFKSYWYNGEAELSSYELEFYRYGEKREGKAMLIFVTEDFLKDAQVKANSPSENTISVMKLNSTKKFNTGIYPYSIMQSAFLPLKNQVPVLKLTSSIQEWCGQSYAQLNHRGDFEIEAHSYFEGEADSTFEIHPTLSENQIWIQLRINPKQLKLGEQEVLPDFSYLQLNHKKFKSYKAELKQSEGEYLKTNITYKDLGRTVSIYQQKSFPFSIEKWEETEITPTDTLISKARKIKTLKTKYWEQNSSKYLHLRDSLSL
ncbi:MAG: septum formation inhibitor Maf [Psychroflexus sp.]